MAIVKNIETVKRYVRLSFSSQSPMLPDFDMPEQLLLRPLLGEILFSVIQTDAAANEPGQPALLELCRKVVVPYAYATGLPAIQVQLSDTGLHSVQDENKRSAFRWEHEKMQEQLFAQASLHYDMLVKYLFDHAEDLAWDAPSHVSTVFKTGAEFSEYFPLFQPYRVFEQLRPIAAAQLVEFIYPAIGEEFAIELLAESNPDADKKKAISLLKHALAQITIQRSIELLNVGISAQGFTVLLGSALSTDAITNGKQQADANALSTLYNRTGRSAQQFLAALLSHLNDKASETVFTTFYNSSIYVKPGTAKADPNANRKGIFGL